MIGRLSDWGDETDLKSRAKFAYAAAVVALPVVITLASFLRDRDHLLNSISFWFFVVCFIVTVARVSAGLATTVLLLTVSPALHLQFNSVLLPPLHALNYPGVDCCIGFLAGWACKGGVTAARPILRPFPATWLLVLHAWIAASALIAVARNIWQSGSEFVVRGFLYNIYLLRQLSWHDDYFPLHDLFAYSTATGMIIAVCALLRQHGQPLFQRILTALVVGFAANAILALLQKITGAGWSAGGIQNSVNAFWPDLHSFAALSLLSLAVGYGYLSTSRDTLATRGAVALVMLLSAASLYFSGSRSTILIVCGGLAALGLVMTIAAKGRRRFVALVATALLLLGVDWMLRHGYRGLSYQSLRAATEGLAFPAVDSLLSSRPGIWRAALQMYSEFPWFGLGQGTFYRLSAIPEFSANSYLVSAGGENAHNYLLQTFVELGPIGLALIFICCLPMLRQGRNNLKLISFYALLAILLANLFAHALLVREMLMLCAVFIGMYCWESGGAKHHSELHGEHRSWFVVGWVAAGFLTLAAVETAHSFRKFPFTYGQRCFQPITLAQDGWTSGLLQHQIPDSGSLMQLSFSAIDRPDLRRRPLDIEVAVSAGGKPLWSRAIQLTESSSDPVQLTEELPQQRQTPAYLTIKASRCYVPLNLGVTYDRRALGVRVDQLRFEARGPELLPR